MSARNGKATEPPELAEAIAALRRIWYAQGSGLGNARWRATAAIIDQWGSQKEPSEPAQNERLYATARKSGAPVLDDYRKRAGRGRGEGA
jgi:hypothetical protein